MNELSDEKTMTVKQVAEILGITEKTVLNHIEKVRPGYIRQGIKTIIDEELFTEMKNNLIKNYSLKSESAFTVISDIDIHEMTLKVIEYHINKVLKFRWFV